MLQPAWHTLRIVLDGWDLPPYDYLRSKEINVVRRCHLARLAALPDAAIDTAEIPDWSDAVRGGLYRPRKQAITTRLDADLIAHFKAAGGPYQTAINRALRQWLREHGTPHAAS